jgi:hypothetical protein
VHSRFNGHAISEAEAALSSTFSETILMLIWGRTNEMKIQTSIVDNNEYYLLSLRKPSRKETNVNNQNIQN